MIDITEWTTERFDDDWESARVKFMLKRLGLTQYRRRLYDDGAAVFSRPRLAFSTFNVRFPTFPIFLRADRLPGIKLHLDKRATFPALYRKFKEVPFVRSFRVFRKEMGHHAEGRIMGLVFPRNGFKQGMVIMDDDLSVDLILGTVTYHYTAYGRYVLRPFDVVLDAIANLQLWQPES